MVSYQRALTATGVAILSGLGAMEAVARHLHPPELPKLRSLVEPKRDQLAEALAEFREASPPDPMRGFHERLADAGQRAHRALEMFCEPHPPAQAIVGILQSMSAQARALEALYALHRFPPISRYFIEEPFHDRLEEFDPRPPSGFTVGLHQSGSAGDGGGARGGMCVYVPESWDGSQALPLVVALHGGAGNGRDFLWTWLREARGRRFLLLVPTSQGSTWALDGPDADTPALSQMVEFIGQRWNLDREHILLTGLSDGATFSLRSGLGSEEVPWTHLAPISGVLHPGLIADGRIERARNRPIYLVHGTLDWMFPVAMAREAAQTLTEAAAQLVFREIPDLSHTYPRDENDRILTWFD
ncbi:MAG: phospholipase/carboxylesterase, partial [Hyphomicrobiaceae bacterium]